MENMIFSVAVAALLHDIGKFAQRAERSEYYQKSDEGLVLPVKSYGAYSHKHALYTLGFLEQKLSEKMDFEINIQQLALGAAGHHNPTNELQAYIALGDRLASGIDRTEKPEFLSEHQFYENPIISVFSLIHTSEKSKIEPIYMPLTALDKPKSPLSQGNVKLSKKEYSALWDSFITDWDRMPIHKNQEQFLLNLDSILERWTSSIPSATYKTDPDVSLYDHSRVTAALAICSCKYFEGTAVSDTSKILDSTEPQWLFVYGDVQGIQKYIFNIEDTKFSSKLLRARSYQIEALCKSAAATIISECGVIPQCELMNGGGNFILVLPNTEKTKLIVKKYQHDINSYLLREYLGMISLNLSWNVEVKPVDFKQTNAMNILQELRAGNFKEKNYKFHSVLEEKSNLIDFYYNKTAGSEPCKLCGYRPVDISRLEKNVCSHCEDLVEKSRKLTSAPWMILKKFHPTETTRSNVDFGFFPSGTAINQDASVFSVNKFGDLPGAFCAFYPQPYSIPHDEDGFSLSFEDIARKSKGTKKLAMFKADVDNLGQIFKNGLGKKTSLSKVASLSRQLHYFFSVELNKFIHDNFADTIYTVYSGGDDICVLGPWDVIFDFADKIHNKFLDFTLHNPEVTISAGIALASSSTPVPYIAEEAESQLEESKHHPEKNAITVFDTTVTWDEYTLLLKKAKEFSSQIQTEKIPTALMRKILQLGKRAEDFQEKGDLSSNNALWLSHLKYTIARIKDSYKNKVPPEYWDLLMQFLTSANYSMMWKSRISVCYALYENRKS